MATCGCRHGPNLEKGKWYGVRSYLHLFYEDCAGAIPDDDLDNDHHSRYHRGCHTTLWKVCLCSGILLLMIGVAALATGALVPPRHERIAEGEFVVVDQWAIEYNRALSICKAVGIILCAASGALVLSSLVSTILYRAATRKAHEDEEEQLSPILKENIPMKNSPLAAPSLINTSGYKKIQSVQPKWDT